MRTPLYLKVEKEILEKIKSGEYKPGDRIPPELELQRIFGVSRITIRQAISKLVEAGFLKRRRGKGTFVISADPSYFLKKNIDEPRLTSKVVKFTSITPPKYVLKDLGLDGGKVFYLVRLRYLDGEPVGISKTYLNPKLVPRFSPDCLVDDSLLKTFEGVYHLDIGFSKISVRAVSAQSREASLLNTKSGSPLLKIVNITYTGDGKAIEFSQSFFRGDKYSYDFILRG